MADVENLNQDNDSSESVNKDVRESEEGRNWVHDRRQSIGFASPATDFLENRLDLNQLLIDRPAATFFMRVSSSAMVGKGILENDIVIIDRSRNSRHGSTLVVVIDGELLLRSLVIQSGKRLLRASNPDYLDITIDETVEIWGTVSAVIRQC